MATSILPENKFPVFFGIWWLLAAILQFVVLRSTGFDLFHIITDSLASNLILGTMCFIMVNNMKYYLPKEDKYWYILVSAFILCLLWLILLRVVFKVAFSNGDPYTTFLENTYAFRFGVGFLLVSSIIMFGILHFTQQEQKELMQRQAESERLNKEAELNKLRQQLQPHFLFNSLNSISSLTAVNPEKARQMIQQLSDFLRGMLKKDEEKFITLKNEFQYLSLYLEIEKVRFGHRLRTKITSTEAEVSALIPPMILQPVVENAIKYGLYDTLGDVLISIEAAMNGHNLVITVSNPFDPESGKPAEGTGFGLDFIKRRLFLLYSRNDLAQTEENENMFVTKITIPQL